MCHQNVWPQPGESKQHKRLDRSQLDLMTEFSRRRFLQLTAATGGALAFGDLADQVLGLTGSSRTAAAGEPIKIGILDPR